MLQVYGAPMAGPWDPPQEGTYQQLRAEVEGMTPLTEPRAYAGQQVERFDRYRLGRLCAALRPRPPDERIGTSILVYRLGPSELATALSGPPPYGK
jgi:hypothetical protein